MEQLTALVFRDRVDEAGRIARSSSIGSTMRGSRPASQVAPSVSCSSISTISSWSTTALATTRAINCWWRDGTAPSTVRGRGHGAPGSVATSSPSCSTDVASGRDAIDGPNGSRPPLGRPFTIGGPSLRQRQHRDRPEQSADQRARDAPPERRHRDVPGQAQRQGQTEDFDVHGGRAIEADQARARTATRPG